MVWVGIQGQNMRPNRLSHIYTHVYKSKMNTVLFVNATIGFSENLFLVIFSTCSKKAMSIRGSHKSLT